MPYLSHEQDETFERSETEESVESDLELRDEPTEDGGLSS
jgi:hypothetical protein